MSAPPGPPSPPPIAIEDTHWHLDRRVPLALIMTVALQFAAIVYWGAQLGARVDVLERQLLAQQSATDRLARVEVKLDEAKDRMERIEQALSGRR